MAPEIANPASSLNPTKFGIRRSLRPKIPSSDGLGEGCHGLRHNRSDEVEGRRDAAPAAMPRWGPRPANEAMTPQIQMVVSNWYTDELGNQARFIKTRE